MEPSAQTTRLPRLRDLKAVSYCISVTGYYDWDKDHPRAIIRYDSGVRAFFDQQE